MLRPQQMLLFPIAGMLLFSLPQAALAQSATTALFGKWQLDAKKTIAAAKATGIGADSAESFKDGNLSFRMEFTADGKASFQVKLGGEMQKMLGRWKVLKEERGKMTIELEFEEGGTPEKQPVIVTYPDRDTVQLVVAKDEQLLVLNRVVEKE